MENCSSLYRSETTKSVGQFIEDFKALGAQYGFMIHNESSMEMANTFGKHGVQVAAGFDLHMIQICKPEKAAGSLQKNPERAALMPKFVTVFTAHGKTQVRFLRYRAPMLEALIADSEFASSVGATYDEIERAINEAL